MQLNFYTKLFYFFLVLFGKMDSGLIPGGCVCALGGLVFGLGLNVSLNRRKYKVAGAIPQVRIKFVI